MGCLGHGVDLYLFPCYAKSMQNYGQKGQVLLTVVLVMVIGLTVGLSLASRTITNLRTTQEEATSQQALSAAEAGIEQATKNNTSIANGSFLNNATYNTSITQVSGENFLLNGGNLIAKDDGVDVWLSDYSTESAKLYLNPWSGSLSFYFGSSSNGCNEAALEIVVISGTKEIPVSKKYAFDPCSARISSNSFSSVSSGGTVSDKNFPFKTTINVASGLIARVVPLYKSTPIGVVGDSALPAQGSIVTSTGTSGNTSRKITVFQGYPTLPSEYFPYGLFVP